MPWLDKALEGSVTVLLHRSTILFLSAGIWLSHSRALSLISSCMVLFPYKKRKGITVLITILPKESAPNLFADSGEEVSKV
jgi:hypothetical protein